MPIRQGRKVTELTALNSASLNTYVVGVDNDITYKISLDVLEDAVVKLVSSSTDARLDSLESYTSSFSGSTNITSLNSFTSSVDTRLDTLESEYEGTEIRLNNLETNTNLENSRLDNIESETGSYLKPQNSTEFYVPLFSSGNIVLNSNIKVSGSCVLIGTDISNHPEVPEKLAVYAGDTDYYNLISGYGTINNYLQLNIKNSGTYGNSSSDVVATADNGTEDEFYVNMGINGSGYDEDTIVGSANDTYVYGAGYNFHIGNVSEYPVMIFAGGSDSKGEHLKMIIDPFDNHTMTGSFEINGNLNVLHNITASNISTINQTISGSLEVTGSVIFLGNQMISGTIELYDITGESETVILFQQDRDGSISISNGLLVPADGIRIPGGQNQIILKNDTDTEYDTNIQNIDGVGLQISSSGTNDAILEIIGHSLNLHNTFTASISEGYIWVGNSTNKTYEISTSSFATTGSNTFIGNTTMTGSLDITGSGSINGDNIVGSNSILKIETITSASYSALTPVSGTLYIIID